MACIFHIGNNHPNWLSYFLEGLKPPTRNRCLWNCSWYLMIYLTFNPSYWTYVHQLSQWTGAPRKVVFSNVIWTSEKPLYLMVNKHIVSRIRFIESIHWMVCWWPIKPLEASFEGFFHDYIFTFAIHYKPQKPDEISSLCFGQIHIIFRTLPRTTPLRWAMGNISDSWSVGYKL
jgi:hypothetical protein